MRRWAWLERTAPGLHHFLVRSDRPFPALRELLAGALLILVLLLALYGSTGQAFPSGSPIVVVTTGSMMHCTNGHPSLGKDCDAASYGRIGTIDPGDLVFVHRVAGKEDVTTVAGKGKHLYGADGDVIVYRPGGRTADTPIIHRVLFWVQAHADGTASVAELGIVHSRTLDQPSLTALTGCSLRIPPADGSGFITRGDNNPLADQCSDRLGAPVRLAWALGKARGEVPWVGLIKLFVDDLRGNSNFANAATDCKVMLLVVMAAFVGTPYAVSLIRRRRNGA